MKREMLRYQKIKEFLIAVNTWMYWMIFVLPSGVVCIFSNFNFNKIAIYMWNIVKLQNVNFGASFWESQIFCWEPKLFWLLKRNVLYLCRAAIKYPAIVEDSESSLLCYLYGIFYSNYKSLKYLPYCLLMTVVFPHCFLFKIAYWQSPLHSIALFSCIGIGLVQTIAVFVSFKIVKMYYYRCCPLVLFPKPKFQLLFVDLYAQLLLKSVSYAMCHIYALHYVNIIVILKKKKTILFCNW